MSYLCKVSAYTRDKRQITKLFLDLAGLDSSPIGIKLAMREWWFMPFSPTSLRLTCNGSNFLHVVLDLECYTFTLKKDLPKSLKITTLMNKHLSSPFYLDSKQQITLYGEQDAVMMGLYCGDINQYVENFAR